MGNEIVILCVLYCSIQTASKWLITVVLLFIVVRVLSYLRLNHSKANQRNNLEIDDLKQELNEVEQNLSATKEANECFAEKLSLDDLESRKKELESLIDRRENSSIAHFQEPNIETWREELNKQDARMTLLQQNKRANHVVFDSNDDKELQALERVRKTRDRQRAKELTSGNLRREEDYYAHLLDDLNKLKAYHSAAIDRSGEIRALFGLRKNPGKRYDMLDEKLIWICGDSGDRIELWTVCTASGWEKIFIPISATPSENTLKGEGTDEVNLVSDDTFRRMAEKIRESRPAISIRIINYVHRSR